MKLRSLYDRITEGDALAMRGHAARERQQVEEAAEADRQLFAFIAEHCPPDADCSPPPRTADPVGDLMQGIYGPCRAAQERAQALLGEFSKRRFQALDDKKKDAILGDTKGYSAWLDELDVPEELVQQVMPLIDEARRQFAIAGVKLNHYLEQPHPDEPISTGTCFPDGTMEE